MRFSLTKKNKAFQKSYMKVGVKKLIRAGMMPARTWGVRAMELSPTERLKLRKTDGSCCQEKKEYDIPVFVHGSIRS